MQAIADELDCAIGTIYTYFPSKAALMGSLATQGIETLRASYLTARQSWEPQLEQEELDDDLVPLVQLLAYAGFFGAAAVVFADEFALQRSLLEAPASRQVLLSWLEDPRRLVASGTEAGVLVPDDPVERALRWVTCLNAVLALDRLAPLDRHLFRATHHARALTADLLVGWGAGRDQVEVAAVTVDRLTAAGPLAPPPDR